MTLSPAMKEEAGEAKRITLWAMHQYGLTNGDALYQQIYRALKHFHGAKVTDAQIAHMVDRFLGWKLPSDFSPDGGISFKKTFNDHMTPPMRNEPIGTNLFDATQADAMVRYMIEGLPEKCR